MDFSETIVVCDIKVGRWCQLNENMKLYEYQRSRSFIDLGPSHSSDSIFSNFFSSVTARPIEAKFHVALPWKVSSNGLSHITKMAAMITYMVKTFKIFFYGTKRLITLKLDMQHLVLKYYPVSSNDDSGLTVTCFTARSNLVPFAYVWENA